MSTPLQILQHYWKYPAFRPMQEEIIQSVLEGKDTLALLPTGGGKSICFQVPALAREGICIVVSPLIALMKDQVEQLQKRKIPAAAVYSGMHSKVIDRILDEAVAGSLKFLYLSPERLKTELARVRIAQMKVNLFAIDEAHCISQWGYDFRPPYLDIPEARDLHPKVPVLALTASATPQVVEDIQEKLDFRRDRAVLQTSFARPNLAYVVLPEENKFKKLTEILTNVPGTGVVYVRNRKRTRQYAEALQKRGFKADFYHAGLSPDERDRRQTAWMNDQTRVVVTTNAFGMGIDKPNVRTVVHLDLPDSLEAYFQEAGRAGRDGDKAYAILLIEESDKQNLRNNFERSFPPLDFVRRVYQALGSYLQLATGGGEFRSFDFDLIAFTGNFDLPPFQTHAALRILERAGWLTLNESTYIPATVKVLLQREALYDYQLRNKNADRIIKAVLRLHTGAFTDFVRIHEQTIAGWIKMSVSELQKQFQLLHRDRVIRYRPSRDQPQLTFLRPRVRAEELSIDHRSYEFLKQRQAANIESAIQYVETVRCRSKMLLEYFGESDPPRCGQCDVCLGRTAPPPSLREHIDRYAEKIELVLRREALTPEEILDSFAARHRELVGKTIDTLLDERKLVRDERGRLRFS